MHFSAAIRGLTVLGEGKITVLVSSAGSSASVAYSSSVIVAEIEDLLTY